MSRQRYESAQTFEEFLESAQKNRELWIAIHDRARIPQELVARAESLGGRWHLLVISEDWCGDAVNIVPVLARFAERTSNVDLRLVGRDTNPDLMDAHLTGTSRSIPVVIVLDENYQEVGWWGPRPTELQAWVMSEGMILDKDARYKRIRTWFARDRGHTSIAEVVVVIEENRRASEGHRPDGRIEADRTPSSGRMFVPPEISSESNRS